jgi:hypothetical protein
VLGQAVIIGNDGTGVAHRAEILARIERIGRSLAKGADLLPLVARQMRLRAVFDDPELVLARDRHDRIHVRRLPVKMHRNDADRARRDRRLDRGGIDREGRAVRIAEHHGRAGMGDHGGGRYPGMGRGDNLVAGLYLQCRHGEIERVGAVGTGHAMLDLGGARELPLESIDIGAADESVVTDDGGHCAIDLTLDGLILELQIGKGDGHRRSFLFSYVRTTTRRAGLPA